MRGVGRDCGDAVGSMPATSRAPDGRHFIDPHDAMKVPI